MNTVLKIKNLDVRFPGLYKTVYAVRDVSISLRRGEIVSLVGESGSGKTITAMTSLGLLPRNAVVNGECEWLGENLSLAAIQNQPPKQGAIIFQNPLTALNPFFTVGEQLKDVAMKRRGLSQVEANEAIQKALTEVHLPGPSLAINKYPHQLSGGQIQRIVIAMALICEPAVLIADEPTTALDVTVQAQILMLLKELAETKGMAVLLITHDLGVVGTISDRVEVMYAGQIIESGDVKQVLLSPKHPYTAQLLATVPKLDSFSDDSLHFIPGQVPDLSKAIKGCAFYGRCEKSANICSIEQPTEVRTDSNSFTCHQPWLETNNLVKESV